MLTCFYLPLITFFHFTGTIGDVIFYKLNGEYYVRMKGSYNTKALQKPGARPLMQLKQQEFGQASKLASQVYRQLPKAEKKQGLFGQFTKTARQFLREGKTGEEIIILLKKKYFKEPVAITKPPKVDPPCLLPSIASLSMAKPTLSYSLLKDLERIQGLTVYPTKQFANNREQKQKRPELHSSLGIIHGDG